MEAAQLTREKRPLTKNASVLAILLSDHIESGLSGFLSREDLQVRKATSCEDALKELADSDPDLVIVECRELSPLDDASGLLRLAEAVDARSTACLLLAHGAFTCANLLPDWVEVLHHEVSSDELVGRLMSVRHYQTVMHRAQLETRHLQRVGRYLDKQYAELDQEMRLACRLQQEFLPSKLPEVPGISFSVLYRPAGWVSGDLYDVYPLDDDRVCLYVADAVGHGVAAGLLTVYVKRILDSYEAQVGQHEIPDPSDALQRLNEALAAERLNNSQFVTATYAVLNHRDLTLRFARGGHPYPVLIEPDGNLSELQCDGALLGLFPGQKHPTKQVQLRVGQKLILYSDGMEQAFVDDRDRKTGEPRFKAEFQALARLPAEDMIQCLKSLMDAEEGSIEPRDDMTVLVTEITG